MALGIAPPSRRNGRGPSTPFRYGSAGTAPAPKPRRSVVIVLYRQSGARAEGANAKAHDVTAPRLKRVGRIVTGLDKPTTQGQRGRRCVSCDTERGAAVGAD